MHTLNDFSGNIQVKEMLASAITDRKLSHSYIIEGPKGSGKKTLSGLIAVSALCTGNNPPCGTCPSCRKGSQHHPDITRILGSGVSGSIGVDTIRALRADAYIMPNEGIYKIYIVEDADKMTVQAQNALLLVFEEPPSYTLFFLLCENYQKLLPTIRSRAVHLTLSAVPSEECIAIIKEHGYTQQEAQNAAASAGFIIGRALQILSAEDSKLSREAAVSFLRCLISGSEHQMLALSKKVSATKDTLIRFLEYTNQIIRDVFVVKSHGDETLYFENERALCKQAAGALTNGQLMDIIKIVRQLNERMDANLSLPLGATVFYMLCWEAIH